MAEYGTVVPTGMFVEDARRALSLIVHTLTHTQPLSRGHIMTGRQQANKDRPPGRMQMQSRRKVMRRPPQDSGSTGPTCWASCKQARSEWWHVTFVSG